MRFGDGTVVGLSRNIRSPKQKRNIQKTVDNKPIIVFCTQSAPGLNKSPFRLKTRYKVVGRGERRFFCLLVSGQLVGGDTGRSIQKSHIVVIDIYAFFDAVKITRNLALGGIEKVLIAGQFVHKVQFARPKSRCPFRIFGRLVKIMYAVRILKLIGKTGQTGTRLCGCLRHRRF